MLIGLHPSAAMDPSMVVSLPSLDEANEMVCAPAGEAILGHAAAGDMPQQHLGAMECVAMETDMEGRPATCAASARATPFVFTHGSAPPIRTTMSSMGAHQPQLNRMSPDGFSFGSSPAQDSCLGSPSPWSMAAHSHPTSSSLLAGSMASSQQHQSHHVLVVDPHLKRSAARMTRSASSVELCYTVPERRVRGGHWGRPSPASRDDKLRAGLSRTTSRDIWDMLNGQAASSPVSSTTTTSSIMPHIYKVRSSWSLPQNMSYMSNMSAEAFQVGPVSATSAGGAGSRGSLVATTDTKVHGGAMLAGKEMKEQCVHGGQPKHSTSMTNDSPKAGSLGGWGGSLGDLCMKDTNGLSQQQTFRSQSHPNDSTLEASLSNASLMLRSSSLGLSCFGEASWGPVMSQMGHPTLPASQPSSATAQAPAPTSNISLDATLATSSLESSKVYTSKVSPTIEAGAVQDLSRQNSCDMSQSGALMIMSRSPSLGVVYKVKLGSTPTAYANGRSCVWSCNNSIDDHVGPLEASVMLESPTCQPNLLGTRLSRAMLSSSAHSSMGTEGRVSLLQYVDACSSADATQQQQQQHAGGASGSSGLPRL